MKKRMGRPPLPTEKARSIVFQVRISPEEQESILKDASKAGKSPTEWARMCLLNGANRAKV
jgi:predicted HicB family RNase H-like nuclease